MNRFTSNLLALDVGARLIGTAIFENQRLVFYGVKSIKKPSQAATLSQLQKVLQKLIFRYDVQVIVLRKLVYPQQQNSFAKVVSAKIESFANEKNIKLFRLEPLFVQQVICKGKNVSKQNAFAIIAGLYPELSKAFEAQRIWQKMYYAYLFNAVAVGLVFVKSMRENRNFNLPEKPSKND